MSNPFAWSPGPTREVTVFEMDDPGRESLTPLILSFEHPVHSISDDAGATWTQAKKGAPCVWYSSSKVQPKKVTVVWDD